MSFPPNPLNLHIWVAANHHHAREVPILHRAGAEERPLASNLLCDGKHLLHLSEPHRHTDCSDRKGNCFSSSNDLTWVQAWSHLETSIRAVSWEK